MHDGHANLLAIVNRRRPVQQRRPRGIPIRLQQRPQFRPRVQDIRTVNEQMPLEAHAPNVRRRSRKATPFPVIRISRRAAVLRTFPARASPSSAVLRCYKFSVLGERSLAFRATGASPRLRALTDVFDDDFLAAAAFVRFFGAVLVFIVK